MNLPISMLCDKKTTNIAVSQVNFINFLVEPTIKEFGKLLGSKDRSHNQNINQRQPTPITQQLLTQLKANMLIWDGLKDVFEQYKETIILCQTTQAEDPNSRPQTYPDLNSDFFSYENYQKRKKLLQSHRNNNNTASPSAQIIRPSSPHAMDEESKVSSPPNQLQSFS